MSKKKSPYDASVDRRPKSIRGHSHVPRITKGVILVGTMTGRMSYNDGPTAWHTNTPKSFGGAILAQSQREEFFGKSMCGDCISTKVTGGHDRNVDKRRVCQLCGTLWPGLEPDNNRRQAIADQKARKR